MKRFYAMILLLVSAQFAFGQADCSDFFFSEYVEGSSQNKALEIYNPTSAAKSLNDYTIRRYRNGEATSDTHLDLVGTVASYDVWIVVNGQIIPNSYGYVDSALYILGDQLGTGDHATCPMYFNGNDALTLERISTGAVVDIFARIGPPDPVSGWYDQPGTSGNYTTAYDWQAWTVNHTLIRKPTVKKGVASNPNPFNVSVEWDSLSVNTWTNLGQHQCDCQPAAIGSVKPAKEVYFFPNPVVNGKLTVKASEIIKTVEVLDILGNVVFAGTAADGRADMFIDLNNPLPGLYVVRVKFEDSSVLLRKIVVR